MKNALTQIQALPDRALFWVGALLLYSGALKVEALDAQTEIPARNGFYGQRPEAASRSQKAPPVFSGT
jgi:hypothetical protein